MKWKDFTIPKQNHPYYDFIRERDGKHCALCRTNESVWDEVYIFGRCVTPNMVNSILVCPWCKPWISELIRIKDKESLTLLRRYATGFILFRGFKSPEIKDEAIKGINIREPLKLRNALKISKLSMKNMLNRKSISKDALRRLRVIAREVLANEMEPEEINVSFRIGLCPIKKKQESKETMF